MPQSVRDAFELPIRDEALAALARLSFARAIEDRMVAASVELYRGGIVDNRDLMMENGARGVQVRDSSSGREARRRELAEVVEYGSQAKSVLATRLAGGPLSGARAHGSRRLSRGGSPAEPGLQRERDGAPPGTGRAVGRDAC